MEDYYEYLDSNGVTTLYKLIKDDTVALIDSYSVTVNGITTNLDNHVNNSDIHTPITDIENMVDTKISGLVNSAPETLDTLKELSDALGNDPNFATTVVNQIGTKADKDSVYTKQETDTLLEGKANSVHSHVVSDITDFPTIPTKLSQLENDMGFGSGSGGVITSISWTNITDKPNFATVATSGSYNDLSNKPTIPNVYNKTLTIQKNGTNVATFTSNSNTDVTADITVPTKVSELSNDSGFITGISWDKVTNKPTLAKVATSGSYTDLSNTPTIPTKVSQLENDTGFINALTDVVDTKSNQTIGGTKTFMSGPWVINSQTTMGYSIKNTALARNEIPTEYQHYTFRAYDKNSKTMGEYCIEKATTGDALLNMNVRSEDASGTQISYGVQFRMTNDGSLVRFFPSANNKVHLGDVGAKWASVHATNAHINNTYTNRVTTYSITHPSGDNNSYFFMSGGSDYDKGATLYLGGISATNFTPGRFALAARKTDGSSVELAGSPNGTLTWGGKSLAIDDNVVHKTGNETINGIKTFTQGINIQKSDIDLTITPTSNKYSTYLFTDKNNKSLGVVQYAQRATDVNDLALYVFDKNSTAHGIQITTNNELSPIGNNYSLGSSSAKWANVYATTFNGNLKGNADSATKASYLDNYSLPGGNKIYLDWSHQVKGYVGLKVDNTVMGGLITTKNIGSQAANSATYATTQAASDNSTKIATTAWVRTYVNSVVGSGSVGASISAYYSDATTLTATGNSSSSGGPYPSDYSDYINISPKVGTIYTGSQLFSSFTPTASGTIFRPPTGSGGTALYQTTAKATANFSGAFSPSAKYLCTTANAVRFRAYVSQGTNSSMGSPSVVDNSSTKSIFIRVQ